LALPKSRRADRLRADEQRIAELGTELAAKGEQNLDLIKAKIETTRKKMEGERAQERPDWN
jgi:recombinational DNA repair ATPase RecF